MRRSWPLLFGLFDFNLHALIGISRVHKNTLFTHPEVEMFRNKARSLGLAAVFTAIAAAVVMAGPPWISIEYPVNPLDPTARGGFVTVRTYHHADLVNYDISGTAEGIVNGQRVSNKLEIKRLTQQGTYVVNWKKPATGNWVLLITTTREGQHMATAVVKVDAAGGVAEVNVPSRTIENGRWVVPRAVASSEVDAMLRAPSTSVASILQ